MQKRNSLKSPLEADQQQRILLGEALQRYSIEFLPDSPIALGQAERIDFLCLHEISGMQLDHITPDDIADYRDQLLAAGLSMSDINGDIAILSRCFETALQVWDIPVGNPVRHFSASSQQYLRKRRFSSQEEVTLLKVLEAPYRDMVIVLLETGMWSNELAELYHEDVNLVERYLLVHQDIPHQPARIVPLSSKAIRVLQDIANQDDQGLVFKQNPAMLSQAFYRACLQAGIRDLRIRDLRYEAICRFHERGDLDDNAVKQLTGYREPESFLP